MPRTLDTQEAALVMRKAKGDIARPYYYNSATGNLEQISKSFETFLILAPPGTKARTAQYITTLLSFDLNNLPLRSKLLSRWLEDEIADITTEREGYQEILDIYDETIPQLSAAKRGFEDVEEVNNLLTSFNQITGEYGEQREALSFDRAVASVLSLREAGALPDELKRELQSYARVLLAYE